MDQIEQMLTRPSQTRPSHDYISSSSMGTLTVEALNEAFGLISKYVDDNVQIIIFYDYDLE